METSKLTDGYWKNENGDTIQLFKNDIFVSLGDGTIINGPATVTNSYGYLNVTYMTKNGVYTTGYVSEDGSQLIFGSEIFHRQDDDIELNEVVSCPTLSHSNLIRIFFQEGFIANLEDAFR